LSKMERVDPLVRLDAEEEEKKDRKDAEERDDAASSPHKKLETFIDTMTSAMDAFGKRMDALEDIHKARKDAWDKDEKAKKDAEEAELKAKKDKEEEEEKKDAKKDGEEEEEKTDAKKDWDEDEEGKAKKVAADKSKKDGEEEEEKKERVEAKKDSVDDSELVSRIARLERIRSKPLSDEEIDAIYDVQSRADDIYVALGKRGAPRHQDGETLLGYRRRLARDLKAYSPTWKDKNLHAIADESIFEVAELQIYKDAAGAALSPTSTEPGTLRAIHKHAGGHEIIEYAGEPKAWMDQFAGPVKQFVTQINTGGAQR
jgi:hypothetical protein